MFLEGKLELCFILFYIVLNLFSHYRKFILLPVWLVLLSGCDSSSVKCSVLHTGNDGVSSNVNLSCRDESLNDNEAYVYKIIYKNTIAIPMISKCIVKSKNDFSCETIDKALIIASNDSQNCPAIKQKIQSPLASAVAYDAFESKFFCAKYNGINDSLVFIRAKLERGSIRADKSWIITN